MQFADGPKAAASMAVKKNAGQILATAFALGAAISLP